MQSEYEVKDLSIIQKSEFALLLALLLPLEGRNNFIVSWADWSWRMKAIMPAKVASC